MTKITHIFFDYDNTLGMTELPAFTACTGVVNKTLASKGVPADKHFTVDSLMKRFVGYSFRRMITDLSAEHGFGFEDGELDRLVADEVDAVVAKLALDIKPTKGVNRLLAKLSADGVYDLSVVSSSALRRVQACLSGAAQAAYFGEQVYSAACYGSSKPDPRVYLEALKAQKVAAENVVAVEDSRTGALAAVGAGIRVIGYLGAYHEHEHADITKALQEAGVQVIIKDWSEFEQALATVCGA